MFVIVMFVIVVFVIVVFVIEVFWICVGYSVAEVGCCYRGGCGISRRWKEKKKRKFTTTATATTRGKGRMPQRATNRLTASFLPRRFFLLGKSGCSQLLPPFRCYLAFWAESESKKKKDFLGREENETQKVRHFSFRDMKATANSSGQFALSPVAAAAAPPLRLPQRPFPSFPRPKQKEQLFLLCLFGQAAAPRRLAAASSMPLGGGAKKGGKSE